MATGQTTKFWATAEAEGFISLCSSPVSYTQQSETEGGGGGGGGGGTGGGSGGGGGFDGFGAGKGGSGTGASYVTPHTRITFAPASKTRTRNPVFRFADSTGQSGTRFRCRVDRKHWKRCSSPLRLKRLSRGKHVLRVLAVNAIGVAEPAPSTRRFKVVPR